MNLQSLANKIDLFTYFLDDKDINIACITEHWLTRDLIDKIKFDNYKIVSSFCRSSRHGGSAIVVRKEIICKELLHLRNLSIEGETEIAAVRFTALKLIVIAVYRIPSGNSQIFFSLLAEVLDQCFDKYEGDQFIFAGDFNVDMLKPSNEKTQLVELFQTYNMKHLFNEPSRVTKSSSSCIDNIFTNILSNGSIHFTYEPNLSDHRAQIMSVSKVGIKNKKSGRLLGKLKKEAISIDSHNCLK